ncbi:hypothetical protein DFA_04708 [Cavenderia fasciculata]|uniref:RNA polymerase II subunit A C-terminal domain phosphatase SSU72 n=1 Tax=Cavenderia fasciculata TaxID=261658 RepID=F4PQB5_CACFS|nr:uncharacterized protein DFA_04708 [Cavenderia fasciculata]EGG22578.1 hypothetical protein DFA_04708 [Cavenderia fasciculata]|eukprot:XP_004360429.1 hypothetical protein DFA_04708 [Cavenderia fasciculata]
MSISPPLSSPPAVVVTTTASFTLPFHDTHEEAVGGAQHALQLINIIDDNDNWEDSMDKILDQFYRKTGRQLLYSLMFY